jgi:hypothetical protein
MDEAEDEKGGRVIVAPTRLALHRAPESTWVSGRSMQVNVLRSPCAGMLILLIEWYS